MNQAIEIVAPVSLRESLDGYGLSAGTHALTIRYVGDFGSALDRGRHRFAALPVFNEAHAMVLQATAQAHPLLRICGVVTDPTGYQTHLAFRSGATAVLNTFLPFEVGLEVLRGLAAHTPDFGDAHTTPSAVPAPHTAGSTVEARAADARFAIGDRDHALLMLLVRDNLTTAEVAKRLYCSERSVYRRLRELYRSYGVQNRRELRVVVTRDAVDQPRSMEPPGLAS